MRLIVIAATGGIGRAVLAQALEAGHDVTAVVRDPSRLDRAVPTAQVDLAEPDPGALRAAVAGADAVLSCLGPRSSRETGIVSAGTAHLLAAMQETGVRRIVAVSGVGLSTVPTRAHPKPPRREPGAGPVMNLLTLPIARAVIGAHMRDVAAMEADLADSGLDWTAVRAPRLVNVPRTGVYQVAYGTSLPRALRIGRADAADFMLRALADPRASRTHATIAY